MDFAKRIYRFGGGYFGALMVCAALKLAPIWGFADEFWKVKDKLQSLYQRGPARPHEVNTNVSLKFLDEYEDLEQFNSLSHTYKKNQPGFPMHSMSTFKEEFRLGILIDQIISCLYSEKSPTKVLMASFAMPWLCMMTWRLGAKTLPPFLDFPYSGFSTTPLHSLVTVRVLKWRWIASC